MRRNCHEWRVPLDSQVLENFHFRSRCTMSLAPSVHTGILPDLITWHRRLSKCVPEAALNHHRYQTRRTESIQWQEFAQTPIFHFAPSLPEAVATSMKIQYYLRERWFCCSKLPYSLGTMRTEDNLSELGCNKLGSTHLLHLAWTPRGDNYEVFWSWAPGGEVEWVREYPE